jgi:hypothetical protein
MAAFSVEKWWKACEIPLVETDWRNIKLYCTETDACWDWNQCIYFIRLSPPYMIACGDSDEGDSPLIYIGSGAVRQRWGGHRAWMGALGRWLPGGRYEFWIWQHDLYKEIESDALLIFRERYRRLPLANLKSGTSAQNHSYDDTLYQVGEADRRYWWALRPTQPDVKVYFEKGVVLTEQGKA